MSDDDIDSILGAHIRNSVIGTRSELAVQQAKAMEYYLGMATGDLAAPGVPGRSQAVDIHGVRPDRMDDCRVVIWKCLSRPAKFIPYDPRKQGDERSGQYK